MCYWRAAVCNGLSMQCTVLVDMSGLHYECGEWLGVNGKGGGMREMGVGIGVHNGGLIEGAVLKK